MSSGPWTCPIHGEYGTSEKPAADYSMCPDCERKARDDEREFERTCRRWRWWAKSSGIPMRYRNRTVTNWKAPAGQRDTAKMLQTYIGAIEARAEAGEGLTLLGPPGLGKTHLLAGIVTAACMDGARAMYASWPDLIDRERKSMRSRDKAASALYAASGATLLAIDEIALGAVSDWQQVQLFELMDYRYRECMPTCVASNLTSKELPDRIGERIADRLRETNVTLLLAGDSKRTGDVPANEPEAFPKPPDQITVQRCQAGVVSQMAYHSPFRDPMR